MATKNKAKQNAEIERPSEEEHVPNEVTSVSEKETPKKVVRVY